MQFLSNNNKKLSSSNTLIAFLKFLLILKYRKYKISKNYVFITKNMKFFKYVLF